MTNEIKLYNLWREKLGDSPQYFAELEGIAGDKGEITDRFYRDLSFGTAGLRGIIGLGTNRMNVFTVRRATQGLCEHLNKTCQNPSVAIAYDSRRFSDVFAKETACVFAANGIKVHLFKTLMPTPTLSYAVRQLRCDSGVVITASHNPAEYNGYKAYDNQGCQLGEDAAQKVLDIINNTDLFSGVKVIDFDVALKAGQIVYIPEAFTEEYIQRVIEESLNPDALLKAGLKVVYTPLNGAGHYCVTQMLSRVGVKDVVVVPEQKDPDGNFPTCPYPNPEDKASLELGLQLAKKTQADILLATDPDSDRVAVAVLHGGDYTILSGNEVGVLLLDYIASTRKAKGIMPDRAVTIKSVVSTKLADVVAQYYNVEMRNVLTGFKNIGGEIATLEADGEVERFIFAFEESCGYLSGAFVRDKDAVNASLLLAELACVLKLEGKTLCDALAAIYDRHGVYYNAVDNLAFGGADGMVKMEKIMETLRTNPPSEVLGMGITYLCDYLSATRYQNNEKIPIDIPSSNIIEFGLADGSAVIVRPSGTEPKIKIYYSVVSTSTKAAVSVADKYSGFFKDFINKI